MVQFDLSQMNAWPPTISAGVLLLFSLVVGALCRFRGAGLWYAVFGAGFALSVGLGHIATAFLEWTGNGFNVPSPSGPDAVAFWSSFGFETASLMAMGLWVWGVVRLLDHYGGRPFRWMGWTGAALSVLAIAPGVLALPALDTVWTYQVVRRVSHVLFYFAVGWMAMAAPIMARARMRQHRPGQAILASAMAAYPIAQPAWLALGSAGPEIALGLGQGAVALLAFLGLHVAWYRVRQRGGGREGLAVMWSANAFLVLAIVLSVAFRDTQPSTFARVYDVVLVAYAILRLQYLDLDIKVRWGLSKGTVAALFIAVFFVISEGASALFSARWGTAIGIAAAGALVFAIAPLMRIADQVAKRAIPVVDDAEALYLAAFRAASADGRITSREEIHLAEVAERLGLGPMRVAEIRHRDVGRNDERHPHDVT